MAIKADSIQFGPFLSGVDYSQPVEDIPEDGISSMENVHIGPAGQAQKRSGYQSYESESAIGGAPTVTCCGEFRDPSDSSTTVFIAAGAVFYEYSSGWVDRTGGMTITAGDDNTFEWVRAFDIIVLTNGTDAPLKWTGAGDNLALLDVDSQFTTAQHVAFWDNRCWMGNTSAAVDRLSYSDIGDNKTWGATNFYNFGSPIIGMMPMQNKLVVHTEDGIWTLIGTANAQIPYQQQQVTGVDPNVPLMGVARSGRSIVTIPGNKQMMVADDGIYTWNGGEEVEKASYQLDEGYWDQMDRDRLPNTFAVYYSKRNEVWFWVPYITSGTTQTNMNHIIIYNTRHDMWFGPYTSTATAFERNCAAIIGREPHAGDFSGYLWDHITATYNDNGSAIQAYFVTSALAPAGSETDCRWLWAKTYYDTLGAYNVTVRQESQGVGVNSGILSTIGQGGTLDSFELDVDTLGTVRMISADLDLRGYDPHSSLQFTNNNTDERFRIRRTHLQYKVIGKKRKRRAGVE